MKNPLLKSKSTTKYEDRAARGGNWYFSAKGGSPVALRNTVTQFNGDEGLGLRLFRNIE